MKILVVSDSHGLTAELHQIKEKHAMETDLMIHCGDSELPAADHSLAGFSVVRGNCDFEGEFSEDLVLKEEGLNVFVTHGHRYAVKSTLMNLSYRAKELNADIVCFGHSHYLGAEMIDNILYVNPGSIRLPRGRTEKTYVILDVGNGGIILRVYDLNQGEIGEMTQEFSLPKYEGTEYTN
ncbi:metallophosphoesterase [Bacillus sp. FJAT-29790]|uniref:metallophosphoesterase n=1 Tax=Bacillus sp. FJAT-29790 TaxID=1895002 RepID=UPI001C243060|nr:metallophosphoesterase [Bacillus sp. FJAT-29790]MBU8879603.1 metallophosphoesterase [Bacillus sp. FJAT-29790]